MKGITATKLQQKYVYPPLNAQRSEMDLEKSEHLGQRSISTSTLRCAHVNTHDARTYLDNAPLL